MSQEYFDIYNEHMEHIGSKPRSEVHKKGYWHKSFQCWFICKEGSEEYILFQKRHANKDTYPNLLDITAAGHLSAGETVKDAARELKEELGVAIDFKELTSVGVIREEKVEDSFIDREFGNVFIYNCSIPMEEFVLQADEVVGMYKASLNEVRSLFEGKLGYIYVEGYNINELGEKEAITLKVSVQDFVPHDLSYYKKIFEDAKKNLTTAEN
jgi:isopentenyldiphosphate isomerase